MNRSAMKNLLIIIVCILVAGITEVSAQSFKVIVNESNSTESISKDDLSDIFLKKKNKWNDGSSIIPVDQNARSATREIFSEEIHNRNVGAIRSYWQQAAFSGAGTAPIERSNDSDVIEFIQANSGAVGYVSESTEVSGVKVLAIE